MPDYRVSPLVQELPATVPFVGPETQERNQGYLFKARIGANESVFGPSPNAIQAMADAASESWMYGDPEFHDLREDLAAHHQVESGNIMVGEGIDGMLGYVARMFLQPGDTVVTSAGAYPTFNYHVNGYGGKLEFVPYRDDREDLDALIQKAAQLQARLIYVSNPDNPMGSWWDAESIESITKKIPENCLLILDEAYGEFAPPGTLPPRDLDNKRLLRMRTFSKAYVIAGM
ncbi:MAG: aminotransferase class I/II-fold pyridoxal phosphate-dependent enzyme, partial [SAR324 cluster bacterium]|nr:aminotransferase class I/II-fold pyridoxal phosphate-dependent enzyme [SAR324 cluster bacterium]